REAFVRDLGSVKRRLELLGYSLENVHRMYDELVATMASHSDPPPPFQFFADVVSSVDLDRVPIAEEPPEYFDFGEYVPEIFRLAEFNKKHNLSQWQTRDAGYFFENLHPYIVLRLLLENPTNLKRRLTWRHADVVDGGWVDADAVYEGLDDRDQFLLITEGTSDTAILRKAIEILRPDIVDFFRFVDVDAYPFSGSGGLYRFCQGLAAIRLQNKTVAIFDNDAVGTTDCTRVRQLSLPTSVRALQLPALPQFSQFRCIGPAGTTWEDINQRAAAIECYLDLAGPNEPTVRWLSYDKTHDRYQGALELKETHTKRFLDLRHWDRSYDFSKLERVLDCLYEECIRCT
ncbi:MAG TPA: HEPN/Toprim-associated domain-containing protein, partial [Candidatus Acidoferrum sp.]|nr:HEPN/Toprim-associated domain-containing protein [Candidatus Acidoferrum sp.]